MTVKGQKEENKQAVEPAVLKIPVLYHLLAMWYGRGQTTYSL